MSLDLQSVLFVTPRWARDGGVGAHVEASAALLARRGVDVHVLTARIESGLREGVSMHHSPQLCKPVALSEKLGDAASLRAELVHFHQLEDPELIGALRQTAPVVISAHGYSACTSGVYYFRPGHECARGHGPGCAANFLAGRCSHTLNLTTVTARYRHAADGLASLRQADMTVSYSSSVDRQLGANGIAHRRIVPYFPTMATEPGPQGAQPRRVVFAGRVVAPKGVSVLIRAAREVDAEFVVCGDGAQLESMRRLARRHRLQDRVRFTGWLGPEQLAEELGRAAVLAVPSVWPEPFGLVGIEAFAAGRPAVASATGGIGDWLEHGVSGLMVPPGDARALARALNDLLADPDRQAEMGSAGRRTVRERFSAERHLEALLESYRAAREHWAA